ncbi:MAG: PEP-CTERM sorting domain-containing protein [FCB group bacterium]|nr:PEP-CTERM sorting domain-containing protein [FCB group bacterium]
MKKPMTILLVILLAVLGGNAFAAFEFQYTPLNAVSSTPFDHNNNTAPIEYPGTPGFFPSPAHNGGEYYDLEGLFTALDDDYLYIALTSSFGYMAENNMNQGDIFLGFGENNYQFAIDVNNAAGSNRLFDVSGGNWNGIPDESQTWGGVPLVADAVGAFEISDKAQDIAGVEHVMTFWEDLENDPLYSDGPLSPITNGDTYVLEWKVDRSLLGNLNGPNIFFHTTLRCGNDFINHPIPEPTTMLLFGLGLVGSGLIKRRK